MKIIHSMPNLLRHLKSVPVLVIAVLFAVGGTWVTTAQADQYDAQIKALQNQNSSTSSSISSLQVQAQSYQDAIDKLQQQISGVRNAISTNQDKQVQLQQQIETEQQKLEYQKKVLGEDLKAMYVGGQLTTVEMLATSKDLSNFVDAATYSSAVQTKIQQTLSQIAALQNQLQDQQNQVKQLIGVEQEQNAQLSSDESQQSQLLSLNQGQQDAYNQQIQDNQSKIASLRAQQIAANRALGGQVVSGDPGHGGYPAKWDAPVPQDSLVDNWGMFNRECVSYAAWKVYQTYGNMPNWGGSGNAKQWPDDARAAGIPTSSSPKVHSVAIATGGAYGHAMWVEAVNGNMIYVSQYNYDLAGHYSEMWVNGSNFTYIYFGE